MVQLTSFGILFSLWGAVTFVLAMLLVYRATVAMKEEAILFLDPAEAGFAADQNRIQRQLAHLKPYVWGLGTLSAGLFVAMGGWVTYAVLS